MKKLTTILFILLSAFILFACNQEPTDETPILDDVPPVINGANDATSYIGVSFNYLEGVTATDDVDGNLTHLIEVTLPTGITAEDNMVIFSEVGSFQFTYSVSDAAGNEAIVTRIVTVLDDTEADVMPPVITGLVDVEIYILEAFDPFEGISAVDDVDGIVTQFITLELPEGVELNEQDQIIFEESGLFVLTYKVSDAAGNEKVETRNITVLDLDVEAPTISFVDGVGKVGQWFDIMSDVSAVDDVDGDVTDQISYSLNVDVLIYNGLVKFPAEGTYEITYVVVDSSGNIAEEVREVTITEEAETFANVVENGDLMLYRHVLVLDGGKATASRTNQTITLNIHDVIDDEDSVYLERRLVSFTGGLETTSFAVAAEGFGALEDLENVEVVAGYYDNQGEFIIISTQPLSNNLTNFTPPVTTTQGAIRLIFRETGSLTISRLWLQTAGGSGSNPNLIRDNDNGAGYLLPYGWVTESTISGFSVATKTLSDGVRAIEVDVTSASNARIQYENITLQNAKTYLFEFDIKASTPQTINAIIGSHGQSTTVSSSGSFANRLLTEVDVTEEWQTISIEYFAIDQSDYYKMHFNLTKASTVFHIANLRVYEKPIESGEEAIYAFRELVYTIGDVTVDSEQPIQDALAYYNQMVEEDQLVVEEEFELLMNMFYEYKGLISLSSSPITVNVNETFNLFDGLDYNDYFGETVDITYILPNGLEASMDHELNISTPMQFEVIYEIYDGDTLLATHVRSITILSPEPKQLDTVMPNGDFSLMKYHVYGQESDFSLEYTRDDVILDIHQIDDEIVYIERSGISFRSNVTATTFNITHTATDIDHEDIYVVLGYYDVDDNFIEEYRNILAVDGVMPSFTSNVTTSHGVMRIEFVNSGSFTLHGVRMQSGNSGVQNIIRDYARAAVNLPAYFNSGSSDLSSFHVTVLDGVFTVNNESSSSTRTIVYENMAMEHDVTYELSVWLKGTDGKTLTWLIGSDYQDTSTGRASSMQNTLSTTFTVTEEWQEYTVLYTTTSSNTYINQVKIYMTFANASTIEMKDMAAQIVDIDS